MTVVSINHLSLKPGNNGCDRLIVVCLLLDGATVGVISFAVRDQGHRVLVYECKAGLENAAMFWHAREVKTI